MQQELFKEYYWQIEKWDGEKIKVKPENAQYIQDLMTSGEGFIKTPTMTINIKDIKDFSQSDIVYTDQKLLESGAQAFNEALINDNGSVQAKWVSKAVTRRKYESYYSANHSYHKVSEDDGHVFIAFKVPTHLINSDSVTTLSDVEVKKFQLDRW